MTMQAYTDRVGVDRSPRGPGPVYRVPVTIEVLPPAARDRGVDLARAVAVVSMLIAHLAPGGPVAVPLQATEWLTAALFAMLAGVGAELSWRESDARTRPLPHVAGALVRAALVIGLGVLLDLPDHQVVIVLVPLGIAMAILAALTRLPSGALAALVIALAVATPALTRAHGATLTSLGSPGWWYELLVVGHPYRVASMVLWGLVGALAVRALRSRRRPMLEIGGASVLVASAATLAVLSHVNRIDASPYSGTYAETALTTCLALAVLLVCRACAPVIPAVVLARLDAVGAMTLTLYAVQIAAMVWYLSTLPPGSLDDSWPFLAGLLVLAFVLPTLWRTAVPTGPFARGPLEGVVDTAVRATRHALR